jgi:hypothetical protein
MTAVSTNIGDQKMVKALLKSSQKIKLARCRSVVHNICAELERAQALPCGSLGRLSREKPQLLNPKEASKLLGLSVKSLANMRSIGVPELPFRKIGARIFYRRVDLMRFRRDRKFFSTSEYDFGQNEGGK